MRFVLHPLPFQMCLAILLSSETSQIRTHEKFLQYKNLKNSHLQDVWSLLSLSLPCSRHLSRSPLSICMVSQALWCMLCYVGSYVGTKTCATWAHETRITWAHFGMFRIVQEQCKKSEWVAWLAYFPTRSPRTNLRRLNRRDPFVFHRINHMLSTTYQTRRLVS